MKFKNHIIKIIVSGLAAITILAIWLIFEIREAYSTRTESNAKVESVTFLQLPQSASSIGYWRDGLNFWAEFDIPEEDFRKLFSKFTFTEITKLTITPKKFGDINTFPPHSTELMLWLTNGLHYVERWNNGGGYDIVYDRARSRAYYSYSRR